MIANKTRVRCTNHNGQHTGLVVHSFGPAGYGIAWDGFEVAPKTTEARQRVRALVKAHNSSITPADMVEVA